MPFRLVNAEVIGSGVGDDKVVGFGGKGYRVWMAQPRVFDNRDRAGSVFYSARRENPVPTLKYAHAVIPVVGDGEPFSALRKRQAIRVGEAFVLQFETGFNSKPIEEPEFLR